MKQGILFTIFCCICGARANSPGPVGIAIEPKDKAYKSVGDTHDLTCIIDEGTQFLFTKTAQWVHKSKTPDEKETVISKQGSLEPDMSSSYFVEMDVQSQVGKILLKLKILKIDKYMDGLFKCVITPTTDQKQVIEEAEAEIVVINPVKGFFMEIDGQKIRSLKNNHKELKEGKYPVTCSAKGSNPDSILHLFIGDDMVSPNHTKQNSMLDPDSGSEMRSYRSSLSYTLDFTTEKFNKILKCKVEINLPSGAPQKSSKEVGVMLEGVSEKPVVECKNTSAAVGDKYVRLVCIVSMKQHIKMIGFRIGASGQVLLPGNMSADYNEVELKELNKTVDEITLKLYKLEDVHFSTNYYLDVIGKDGSTYQYPVYLYQIPTTAAGTLSVAITVPLACFLAVLLQLLI